MGWRRLVASVLIGLALGGCAAQDAGPPAPVGGDGGVSSPGPHPTGVAGPGLGHIPAPRDQGNWSASAATPERTAGLFALGPDGRCECREVRVELVSGGPTVSLVRVRMEGVLDDAIRNMEYLVVVRREGDRWKVASATYLTECRRGVGEDGLCV